MIIDLDSGVRRLRALCAEAWLRPLFEALGPDSAVHLVGGTVRNALMDRKNTDLDLATALMPDEVRNRLTAAGIHVVPTGLKHQTVTAVLEQHVEITTFRSAGMKPTGGVVRGNTIEEDLRFRDFTINALAFSVERQMLIDPTGGVDDLESELVRACPTPDERFREDPLRLLRLLRFSVQLGFSLEEKSTKAACALAPLLAGVSLERIRDEFVKILLSPEPRRGFTLLNEMGFLKHVLPEILPSVGCEQNRFHNADVFVHSLDVVEKTEPDLLLRLSALFHDIGKPHTMTIDEVNGDRHFFKHEIIGAELTNEALERLRFSNEIKEAVTLLVRTHMRPIDAGVPGLRRLLRDTGENFDRWRKLKEADTLSTKIEHREFLRDLSDFDYRIEEIKKGPELSPLSALAIKGKDLLEAGFKESPMIGVILRALHEKVLDNPALNERETLLALAKEQAAKSAEPL